MAKKKCEIPEAKFPEQVGMDSKEIAALVDDFRESEIELHSLMLYRHGKLAFECHASPYGRDIPHTMFSVSKSFVSIAVGFAVEEGLFKLNDRVIDFFPELRPEKTDEWLEKMTVFHLLTMTAGKRVNYLSDKSSADWVKDFINEKWEFEPGTKFLYVSENTYMCGAIIKKLTGLGVVDYLTPRLFEPLGITPPAWERDPSGQEAGGWGMFISPYDLSKVALCVLNKGMYDGKQIIPAGYIEDAISKQADNSDNGDPESDSVCGYGYYFWMNRMEHTERMDGMFSQFAIFFHDYDALLVCTCSEINEQKTRNCIFRHFPQMFTGNKRKAPEDAPEIKLNPLPCLEARPRSVTEQALKGKVIQLKKNTVLNAVGFPPSMLALPVVFMSSEKSGNINNIVFDFREDECVIAWDEGKDHNMISCGMDGKPRFSKYHLGGMDYTAVSTAAWNAENELEIWVRPLESITERRLRFVFSGKSVTVYPTSSPPSKALANGVSGSVADALPDAFNGVVASFMDNLDFIIDAPLKGKVL